MGFAPYEASLDRPALAAYPRFSTEGTEDLEGSGGKPLGQRSGVMKPVPARPGAIVR
jgi:hypothetical protein